MELSQLFFQTGNFDLNASIGYFGASAPMIAAWLIVSTGIAIAPAFWVAGVGLVTLLTAIFLVRETAFEPLP